MSGSGRFWDSFHFPWIDVTSSSTPTIDRTRPSMYPDGASSTDQGWGIARSWAVVREATWARFHPSSSWNRRDPRAWMLMKFQVGTTFPCSVFDG